MNLSESLNSINFTKKNLIRNAEKLDINKDEAKALPSFVINRSLSYHVDCLSYVAMLQQHMDPKHKMTPSMQYEFLLHTIPKGKRFAKWKKPQTEKVINQLMENYNINYNTAKGYLRLLSDTDIEEVLKSKGGTFK